MTRGGDSMRVALAAGNALGEGLVWCGRAQALYWTNIPARTLWRFAPASGSVERWTLPERVAAIGLCETPGWLLLALASRLAFLRLSDGVLSPVCDVEPGLPTRCNDGACDRQGRFVFGTLHEPADSGPQRAVGGFWRLDAGLALERLPLEPVAISNSIAFSPDGRRMYYCDSQERVIRCCDYGDRIGPSRVFADLRGEPGVPDGSTVDAGGCLWNAQWGGSRVVRYRPDGAVDSVLRAPARQPTRPAFGGAGLDVLYTTSARDGLDPAALAAEPGAGALLCATTAVHGLPEPRFTGAPPADVPSNALRAPHAVSSNGAMVGT